MVKPRPRCPSFWMSARDHENVLEDVRVMLVLVCNVVVFTSRFLDNLTVVKRATWEDGIHTSRLVVYWSQDIKIACTRTNLLLYHARQFQDQTVCLMNSWVCSLKRSVMSCFGVIDLINSFASSWSSWQRNHRHKKEGPSPNHSQRAMLDRWKLGNWAYREQRGQDMTRDALFISRQARHHSVPW